MLKRTAACRHHDRNAKHHDNEQHNDDYRQQNRVCVARLDISPRLHFCGVSNLNSGHKYELLCTGVMCAQRPQQQLLQHVWRHDDGVARFVCSSCRQRPQCHQRQRSQRQRR